MTPVPTDERVAPDAEPYGSLRTASETGAPAHTTHRHTLSERTS